MSNHTVEKIAHNTLLQAVARVAMVLAAMALPAVGGLLLTQAATLGAVENRVTVVETRINIDQRAQERFQAETEATLRELQSSNTRILQSLATLIERTDANRRD